MFESYEDIRSRIVESPLWWDEHGVPRYAPFSPRLSANIYADEVVLLDIACQECATRFKVALSRHASFAIATNQWLTIAERIRDGTIHYGDPPNIGCCVAGNTMNCEDLAVMEYWHRSTFEWKRDKSLEISLVVSA